LKNVEFIDNLIVNSQEIFKGPEIAREGAEVDYCDRAVRLVDLTDSENIPIEGLKNTVEEVIEEKRSEISQEVGI
jgi:hypothetical protein